MQVAGYNNLHVHTCTNCQTSMIRGGGGGRPPGKGKESSPFSDNLKTLCPHVLTTWMESMSIHLVSPRFDPPITARACNALQIYFENDVVTWHYDKSAFIVRRHSINEYWHLDQK